MRPLTNQIIIKPREDLEDGLGLPITLNQHGRPEPRAVYGEVVGVGPGDNEHPDIPELRKGDILVWDLSKIGPPFIEHGHAIICISFNAVLGRLVDPKTPQERCQALLDMVLVKKDLAAARKAVSALIVTPDTVLQDGMQADKNDVRRGIYERVVSLGKGIRFGGPSHCKKCKVELNRLCENDVREGDLAAFNPMWAIDWRRGGTDYRFIPFSELRGVVEE